jgi:hypothetical protein
MNTHYKSYSQLSIHEKINARAKALAHATMYDNIALGWYPMRADFIIFDLKVFPSKPQKIAISKK